MSFVARTLGERVVEALSASEGGEGADRPLRRVVEVGAGRRFDVALAVAEALPDAEVWVTDREAPQDVPPPLRAAALDLADAEAAAERLGERFRKGGGRGVGMVDAVLAVRLPPELWPDAVALADRWRAALVLCPLPEETPPKGFEQVVAGVHVRWPGPAR